MSKNFRNAVSDMLESLHNQPNESLARFFSPDAYYQVCVPVTRPIKGRDAVVDEILRQFKLYRDCHCEMHQLVCENNIVVTERTDHVTMLKDGLKISARMCGIFELSPDGTISAWRDYYDTYQVALDIGVSISEFQKYIDPE